MPAISVIIVSHNKPTFVLQAVQSVLAQSFQDWEAFLVDSGVLLKQGFFDKISDARVRVMASGEKLDVSHNIDMASWCMNKVLNSGAVKGELILYLCDDDYFYPRAFDIFWGYYQSLNREPQAMYASQNVGVVGADGTTVLIGQRIADRPAGRFCKGRQLHGQVDYLQFCHTVKILEKYREIYGTTKYFCEDKPAVCGGADGIFLEQIGALTMVHPINQIVSINRRTSLSVNCGHGSDRKPQKWMPHPEKWSRRFERGFRKFWRRCLGWKQKS